MIAGIISASSATTCNTGEHYYAAISANAIRSFVLENVQGVSSR